MVKLLTYRMGVTLPLAQVSCRARSGPQLENKLQALGHPAGLQDLLRASGKAACRNVLQEVWERHGETLD